MSKRKIDQFFTPSSSRSVVQSQTNQSKHLGPSLTDDDERFQSELDRAIKASLEGCGGEHESQVLSSTPHSDVQREAVHFPSRSVHPSYPFPIENSTLDLAKGLALKPPTSILKYEHPEQSNRYDLDLLYFQPLYNKETAASLMDYLLRSLPWYRVLYTAHGTTIKTPRYTTVFGLDETSRWTLPKHVNSPRELANNNRPTDIPIAGDSILLFPSGHSPKPATYLTSPRPIPKTLQSLLDHVSDIIRAHPSPDVSQQHRPTPPGNPSVTDQLYLPQNDRMFNFCLVNLYESGQDSISPHSDDESFLGAEPTIASLSLGSTREFTLQHKSSHSKWKAKAELPAALQSLPISSDGKGRKSKESGKNVPMERFELRSGDMLVMRGQTQTQWLHAVPKRRDRVGPRINITLRKAINAKGSNNYSFYNVGSGPMYRWVGGQMVESGK